MPLRDTARPASFAVMFSELQREVGHALARNGNLTAEDHLILDKMRELYAEVEYLDVIRIGAEGVLRQGRPAARFPRKVREVVRDLEMLIQDGEAGVAP